MAEEKKVRRERMDYEFKQAVDDHGIERYDVRECDFCDTPIGWVFKDREVCFDSNCDCLPDTTPLQPRAWQDLADFYNSNRSHPESDKILEAFKMKVDEK